MEVTSAFQGVTTPVQTLLDEIHRRGWQVTKVDYSSGDNGFKASAKSPYGQQIDRVGPDQATALAAVLTWIVRHEFTHTQARMAGYADTFAHKMDEIAEQYAEAPVFDHKAAAAWKELADDSVARAAALQKQIAMEVTNEPEPYKSVQELVEDVRKHKKVKISRAGVAHPVWTEEQVIAFRFCHDVLGHAAAGAGFNWHGENLATAAHLPWLTPNAQKALFTETLGQSAYMAYYRSYGPQKIAFLDAFKDAQEEHNNPGHSGVHPAETLAPGQMPKVAGVRLDPNANYDAGTPQLPDAGYLWQGDPLESGQVSETARKIDTGWHNFTTPDGKPDWTRIEQAVVNAFRVVLLSPRKDLKWNAVHYQDIAGVPASTTDPKVYWDALEKARTNWNTARGWHPDSHKAYFREQQDFYKWYAVHHPRMTPQEVKEHADREVYNMRVEIEEQLEQALGGDVTGQVLEPKINAELKKRLKAIINPNTNAAMDQGEQMVLGAQLDMNGNIGDDRYGAFMGTHLKQIAQVSSYAPEIARAAFDDVTRYKGTGHHFRQFVLSLGISGVGPKVCSFAWLMLAPMTSELATIDVHMMDVLGHNYEKDMNNRDYFKYERELQAGRDAAGYAHVPLGQFQWGMWDHKRTPGQHQDHSAMRVVDPVAHHNIDWAQKGQTLQGDQKWNAPYWWDSTAQARQLAAQDFDNTLGAENPQSAIPWQEEDVPVHTVVKMAHSKEELCIALDVPEHVRKRIWSYAQTLGLKDSDLVPIEEYHITVVYGEQGYEEQAVHELVRKHNISGMKFKAIGLDQFGHNAIVLRLDSPQWKPWASFFIKKCKEQGIEISEFPGGPKAHITLAYSNTKPEDPSPLLLDFRAGALHLMRPRGLPVEEPVFHHSAIGLIVMCPDCGAEHSPEQSCDETYEQSKRHWYDVGWRSPEAPAETNPGDAVGDLRNLSSVEFGQGEECDVCKGTGWRESPFGDQRKCYKCGGTGRLNKITPDKVMPDGLKIYDQEHQPEFEDYGHHPDNVSYYWRRPVAYHPGRKELYIGPTGYIHGDMGGLFDIPVEEGEYTVDDPDGYDNGGYHVGYIDLNNRYGEEGKPKMKWYPQGGDESTIPQNHQELADAAGYENGHATPKAPEAAWDLDGLDDMDFDSDEPQTPAQPAVQQGPSIPAQVGQPQPAGQPAQNYYTGPKTISEEGVDYCPTCKGKTMVGDEMCPTCHGSGYTHAYGFPVTPDGQYSYKPYMPFKEGAPVTHGGATYTFAYHPTNGHPALNGGTGWMAPGDWSQVQPWEPWKQAAYSDWDMDQMIRDIQKLDNPEESDWDAISDSDWYQPEAPEQAWEPGIWGKGYVHNGQATTWGTGYRDGFPHHVHVKLHRNIQQPTADFWINPKGMVHFWSGRGLPLEGGQVPAAQAVKAHNPQLKPSNLSIEEKYGIGDDEGNNPQMTVQDEQPPSEPRTAGVKYDPESGWHKGMLMRDGTTHLWPVDHSDGWPSHDSYRQQNDLDFDNVAADFRIGSGNGVTDVYSTGDPEQSLLRFRQGLGEQWGGPELSVRSATPWNFNLNDQALDGFDDSFLSKTSDWPNIKPAVFNPWQKGQRGKALVFADGPRAWATDSEGGPHHLERDDYGQEGHLGDALLYPDGSYHITTSGDNYPGTDQAHQVMDQHGFTRHQSDPWGEWLGDDDDSFLSSNKRNKPFTHKKRGRVRSWLGI